jgi:EpsI family protein
MKPESQNTSPRKPSLHAWATTLLFVACALAAGWLTPHTTWFEHLGKPDFDQIIPRSFDNWVALDNGKAPVLIVDPQQVDAIKALYTQTVTRTYMHLPTGRRVMLSLAYGDNQVLSQQLHRPESCYSSQGFKISNLREERFKFDERSLAINRMTAQIGGRDEQVSYWIRIGDQVIEGPPGALNLARMYMGLKGYIADGLLFRVSDIGSDPASSVQLHSMFINDLLNTLTPQQRHLLAG